MAPKEHGAYGQLGFPLLSAMLLGKPTLASVLLVVGSVIAFFAHEPLVLLLGQRGKKALRRDAARAQKKLILAGFGSTTAFAIALNACGNAVRYAVAVNVLCVAVALAFIWKGRERSLLGELWIALTLPLAALPVALANGVSTKSCLLMSASFVLAHTSGIFGVRGIIAEFKQGNRAAGYAGLLVVALGIAALGGISLSPSLACGAFYVVVLGARLMRPSPKSLRPIGWLLIGASALQAAWLVLALR